MKLNIQYFIGCVSLFFISHQLFAQTKTVFTRLGVIYNDTSYFNRMYQMYAFSKYKHGGNGLFNQNEGLWWRDKDFVPPYKEPNGGNCY